jgi:hypothetical protein
MSGAPSIGRLVLIATLVVSTFSRPLPIHDVLAAASFARVMA